MDISALNELYLMQWELIVRPGCAVFPSRLCILVKRLPRPTRQQVPERSAVVSGDIHHATTYLVRCFKFLVDNIGAPDMCIPSGIVCTCVS